MDPTVTLGAVMARHRPRRWLAAVRILRCARGCGRWPCNRWHNARDQRDRVLDAAAIRTMTAIVAGMDKQRRHS